MDKNGRAREIGPQGLYRWLRLPDFNLPFRRTIGENIADLSHVGKGGSGLPIEPPTLHGAIDPRRVDRCLNRISGSAVFDGKPAGAIAFLGDSASLQPCHAGVVPPIAWMVPSATKGMLSCDELPLSAGQAQQGDRRVIDCI